MLSGSAYVQMIKEIDDMIENNYDMASLLNMPPFEFKAYRRHYIDKQNNKANQK